MNSQAFSRLLLKVVSVKTEWVIWHWESASHVAFIKLVSIQWIPRLSIGARGTLVWPTEQICGKRAHNDVRWQGLSPTLTTEMVSVYCLTIFQTDILEFLQKICYALKAVVAIFHICVFLKIHSREKLKYKINTLILELSCFVGQCKKCKNILYSSGFCTKKISVV